MVNEYQYCPRLACPGWVQSEWAASSDAGIEGRHPTTHEHEQGVEIRRNNAYA